MQATPAAITSWVGRAVMSAPSNVMVPARGGVRPRIERIKVDDSLSQLFRSDTPEFKQFQEVSLKFPSAEYDVLIVVEGKALLQRDQLAKLRDMVTDVQLTDSVRGHARCPSSSRIGLPAPS